MINTTKLTMLEGLTVESALLQIFERSCDSNLYHFDIGDAIVSTAVQNVYWPIWPRLEDSLKERGFTW